MINKHYDEQIKKWIADNHDWIIDEWIALAKIPSIKSEPEEGAPFGKECAKALSKAAQMFKEKGFDTEIYQNGGYALAKYGEGEKTMGFFTHSDVVPVGDDWIYTSPFEPVIKDNTLIGRGVEDNKSGIMIALCVMMMARDLKFPIKRTLQTFIGSNEETGMEDIEAFVKEHPMPEISLIPDADFPCSAGEKGIFHYWAVSKENFEQIRDFSGGQAFNVVLDKVNVVIKYSEELFIELSDKTANNSKFTISQNDTDIILCVKGIAKHASVPEGSENAAYLAAELLCECKNLCQNDRNIMKKVATLTKSGFGEGINLVFEDEFFGRLTMANGMVKCENSHLMLSFDTRYGTIENTEVVSRTKEGLLALGFEVEGTFDSPGFNIPENGAPSHLVKVYNEITGKDEKIIYMGGGTYARHLKNAISVGTSVGNLNNFQIPQGHGGPHQCDEMIDIDGFFEALRIIMHYVLCIEKA